jgi:2-aminobenzoate-CoA ligase
MSELTSVLRSAHVDTFARDRMPSPQELPAFDYSVVGTHVPAKVNAVRWLFDQAHARGYAARPLLREASRTLTYAQADAISNQIATVLCEDLRLIPGNRVLLRGANSIDLALTWLAAVKAGLIAVATMPLLRAKELGEIIEKAQIRHALCADGLWEECAKAQAEKPALAQLWRLSRLMACAAQKGDAFDTCPTAADDIAMLAFTSGTTGKPKAAMHTHRDLLCACAAWPVHVLKLASDDVVIGSPPLAFTFGLGGLLLFPMAVGASVVFHHTAYTPETLVDAIRTYGATVCYTAPTMYRQMASFAQTKGVAHLRVSVSAGEALPDSTRTLWREATGIEMLDGIGATEMFHIFISASGADVRRGAIGKVVPGYEAKIVDDAGNEVPRGTVGKLAVRGCTGCKYLDDARQANYVRDGWNYPGDAFLQDADGYFFYQARTDDMIISAGYNIGAPEVEDALLAHTAVAECAVVGKPDLERGMIVKAFVVLRATHRASDELIRTLQEHVKSVLAPYKYPREIEFVATLPRTETGKLQRFRLRSAQ